MDPNSRPFTVVCKVKVPVGKEAELHGHITEVQHVHMARTGEAVIMMNNELKQEERGGGTG